MLKAQVPQGIVETEPREGIIVRMLREYGHGLFVMLIPVCGVLTWLASRNPGVVEAIYTAKVYKAMAESLGRLFGLVPFSVSEIMLVLIMVGATGWIVTQVVFLIRRGERGRRLMRMLADVCCVAGIGYLMFTMLCGLNYQRISFAEQSGLEIREASAWELAEVFSELVEEANRLRGEVAEDENGVMTISEQALEEIIALAPEGMERLSERYPVLSGYTPPPKPVVMSRMMSGANIVGIYIPFTFEANFNRDVPAYHIPFSMLHELSHFKGFMREDEANFLSYLACRELERAEFAYSGTLNALIHCANALYRADRELYWECAALLSEDVLRDMAANTEYWRQFEGPVAEAAEKVNDAYLKTNLQSEGVKSYGRMVDLLLAEYRQRHDS